MAGHASNWFKPRGGVLKGQSVYLSRPEQADLRLQGSNRTVQELLDSRYSFAVNDANASRPRGAAISRAEAEGFKRPIPQGTYTGPIQSDEVAAAKEAKIRSGYIAMTPIDGSRIANYEELAKKYGYSSVAEMEERQIEHMRQVVSSTDVATRVSSAMLPAILDSYFKNQYASKKSSPGGAYDPKYRKETEEKMFGIPPGSKPKDYPIYGYLEPKDGAVNSFAEYGDVRVRFKEAVKLRTTMTHGDSLSPDPQIPSPLTKPRLSAIGGGDAFIYPKSARPTTKQLSTRRDGFEAQIHGKLTAADIADITFTKAPDAALSAKLDALNIPWKVDGTL